MSRAFPLLALLALAACAAPTGVPSLAPRTAEGIDPRVPVVNAVPMTPADPALVARLAELVASARSGDTAFRAVIGEAQRLAAAAGPSESESWIAAQQALSVAVAARAPTTRALGDIDAITAARLARDSGIASGDYAAIQAALAEVAAIEQRQAASIDALQRRLGG